MSRGKIVILLVIPALIVTGLFGAGGYSYWKVKGERNRLRVELDKTEKRGKLLQRKYVEEKARADNLLRVKQAAEARQQESRSGYEEELKSLKASFEKEKEGLVAACERKTKELSGVMDQLKEKAEKLRNSRDEVVARFKQKAEELQEQKRQTASIDEQLRKTAFERKRVQKQFDNCKEHNERFCMITEELVEKYKNKGVVGSLMVNEPFTQVRQVEVDKLVQEYTDKIDKERME